MYHWLTFLIAAVLAEIPWNLLVGTLFFFGWYFPVGMYPLSMHLTLRFLEKCHNPCGSCSLSMVIFDGLGVIYQHLRTVYMLIRTFLVCANSNYSDAQCAHSRHDYFSLVFSHIDLCRRLPASG